MKWLTRKRHPAIKRATSVSVAGHELRQHITSLTGQINCLRDKPPSQDFVYLQQASLRIRNMLKEVDDLTRGRLTFKSTETWRTVYQTVLSTSATKR